MFLSILGSCYTALDAKLLNAVEHDLKNYQAEICCYQPKAEVDNDKLKLYNSSFRVKTVYNNCFIIYLKE